MACPRGPLERIVSRRRQLRSHFNPAPSTHLAALSNIETPRTECNGNGNAEQYSERKGPVSRRTNAEQSDTQHAALE